MAVGVTVSTQTLGRVRSQVMDLWHGVAEVGHVVLEIMCFCSVGSVSGMIIYLVVVMPVVVGPCSMPVVSFVRRLCRYFRQFSLYHPLTLRDSQ